MPYNTAKKPFDIVSFSRASSGTSFRPVSYGVELLTSISISGTNATNTGSSTATSFSIDQTDTSAIVTASLVIPQTTIGKLYFVALVGSASVGSFKIQTTNFSKL